MQIRKYVFLLIFIFSVSAYSDLGYKIGSAEIYGAGGNVFFPDTGYAVLFVPSMMYYNTKKTVLSAADKYLFSYFGEMSINDFSAGVEYKMSKYTIGLAGNYFKMNQFQNMIFSGGAAFSAKQNIIFGAGLILDKTESQYDSIMKFHFTASASYALQYIILSAGSQIFDISGEKIYSLFFDSSLLLGHWKIGWRNMFLHDHYRPILGAEFDVKKNLLFRMGINSDEYSLGLGVKAYHSIIVNYAFLYHRELGYSHIIDIKLSY